MVLECTGHDQKRAMAEVELHFILVVVFAPELECSRSTEGNGGNRGVRTQFALCVLMPADAVAFIPIQVEKQTVELDIAQFIQPIP